MENSLVPVSLLDSFIGMHKIYCGLLNRICEDGYNNKIYDTDN